MVEFIRGDTQPLKTRITYKNGENVEIDDIDVIVLTCRKGIEKEDTELFKKTKEDFTFLDDYYHFTIEPEDTQDLEYGKYCCDIEVTLKNNYRKTLFFEYIITGETTFHAEEA